MTMEQIVSLKQEEEAVQDRINENLDHHLKNIQVFVEGFVKESTVRGDAFRTEVAPDLENLDPRNVNIVPSHTGIQVDIFVRFPVEKDKKNPVARVTLLRTDEGKDFIQIQCAARGNAEMNDEFLARLKEYVEGEFDFLGAQEVKPAVKEKAKV